MLEASRLDLSSAALPYVRALGMLLRCGMKHNHLGEYSERPRAKGASWIPGEHRVYYVCTGILYEVQNTEHGAWSLEHGAWSMEHSARRGIRDLVVQHARGSHSSFPRASTRPAFHVWEIRGSLSGHLAPPLTSSTTDNVALLRRRTPVTAARNRHPCPAELPTPTPPRPHTK